MFYSIEKIKEEEKKIDIVRKNMSYKSKILIIGGTGYIGPYIVKASLAFGHPTFILVREESSFSNPTKAHLIDSFKSSGVVVLYGDIEDYQSILNAVKLVDVVISAVGFLQIPSQKNIIAAIKEAGNIKRFFPSEYGNDVDRVHPVEPAKSEFFEAKARIRRAIESEGVPYTYLSSNSFAGFYLPNLCQHGLTSPPRDKVTILGDGDVKVVFVKEEDIGAYTIKSVDDPRTLNKVLYLRPPANTLSMNELVSLWEKKIGNTLERVYVTDKQLLKNIEEAPLHLKVLIAIYHSVFVKGDHANFEIEESFGAEASQLYPDVKYTTVDEYLNQFL